MNMLAHLINYWLGKVLSLSKRVKSEALYKNNKDVGLFYGSQYAILNVLIVSRLEALYNSRPC